MPQFQRRPLAAAVIMMFSAPAALAQSQPAPQTQLPSQPDVVAQAPAKPEQTLPEVKVQDSQNTGFRTEGTRTGTRTDTPLRDIPQFINTVPQALIRSQGATTLQDALRNVPGVSYAAAEGGTQANQVFYLRGFPINQDIFIDGVRDLGEYNRDLFATESVEVLKGSSALMFGRGSTGGVINQIAKTADRLERREVGVTFGSFDQKRATADFNVRTSDSSALRLVALTEDSGSFRFPQGVEKTGFAPSFWMHLGSATDVTLSYYYLNEKGVTDYGQPTRFANGTFYGFPTVSPRTYYGFANNDFADYETHIATFKLEHAFSDKLSLRNTLRWANYKRQSESTIAQGVSGTDANGNPVTAATPASLLLVTRNHDSNRTRDNDDGALINQTELTWKLQTGATKHTVLTGLELAREKLNRWNYTLDAVPGGAVQAPSVVSPYLAPNPYQTLTYSKTPNQTFNTTGDTVALYAQDQLEFSEHWKALLGMRWERFATDYVNFNSLTGAPVAPNASFQPAGSKTDKMLSGRAGLIWQPTNTQSYYVSWGNSYNPSGELGVYGQTGSNLSTANLNVDPEKNQNYEVGAQWDFPGGLQLRTAVFRNEKNNARMADPSGSGLVVLAGKRRVDGVELELTGNITKNWEIYSGIAFMDGKIVNGPANVQGNTPLGVSDVAGSVWSVYKLGGGFELGGGVRGQTGAWLTDTNLPGSQIPDYLVVDATAAYVQKKYEIRLNIYNLTDKTYYIGGYNNSPNRVLPGMPRAATVTVRYNF
jgi:catecholate siderophore receptor